MTFRVVVTATAEEHCRRIQRWWVRERVAAPTRFRSELRQAFDLLSRMPRSGSPYATEALPEVRRLLLRRTGYHVYFTLHEDVALVVIRAIWHAARGSGPELD